MRFDLVEHERQAASWLPWRLFKGNERDIRFARRDLAGLVVAMKCCQRMRVAVQAGGNVGVFPIFLARFFETVVTFEPDPYTFRVLAENCRRCRQANVFKGAIIPFCMALGAELAEGKLVRRRRDGLAATHSGVHHVRLDGEACADAVSVSVQSLDSVAWLHALDLLYLDIEGFELFALKGAEQLIRKFRPVIGIEINKSLDALKISPADVAEFVFSLDYKFAASVGSDRIFVPAEFS